uniref:Ig-like domain-containing protein n=1 Tax=Heterorhabditis bacteriophora TaxID=37862 RepID=A0A1I7WGL9_HETBA
MIPAVSIILGSSIGNYSCLAVNVEGKAIVTVEVQFSKAITFNFVPTNKTVIEGSNVFWHCHANAQPEKITYNWVFQERAIKTTQAGLRADIKDGDLSLQDVRKTDRGWYRCEVTNSLGDLSQSSAYLDVLWTPDSPNLGKYPVFPKSRKPDNSTYYNTMKTRKPDIFFLNFNVFLTGIRYIVNINKKNFNYYKISRYRLGEINSNEYTSSFFCENKLNFS